jgi:drug/metabolite transporter (DMT)-like permease
MATALSNSTRLEVTTRPARWKVLLAFAIIYFVWGSTFLAIRVGVREVPPFLLAGIRFVIAGVILFAWTRAKGTPLPTHREWAAAAVVAVPIFVLDFGLVFWAERRVPSGMTAVMMAMIPLFMTLLEIVFLKTQRLTVRLSFALLVGLCGVGVLVSPSIGLGEEPINPYGALALLIGASNWSMAAILMRKLPLPASKPMSSAAQMLVGGIWLVMVATALGEFRGFDFRAVSRGAWLALAYLIVAGSVIAYTAYVWLLHHESPTKVGTYAYVNPVVAVAVGYFFAGESVGPRTLLGTLLVLTSVVVITTTRTKRPDSVCLEEAPQVAE